MNINYEVSFIPFLGTFVLRFSRFLIIIYQQKVLYDEQMSGNYRLYFPPHIGTHIDTCVSVALCELKSNSCLTINGYSLKSHQVELKLLEET